MKLSTQTKRYLVIGVTVYLFEVLVIVVAQAIGMNGVAAVGLSFWLGLGLSFILQKIVTFQDKRFHYKILSRQVFIYALLVALNFSFTVVFTYLLQHLIPAVVCRTVALGITTIWNFYLYKTRIFNGSPVPLGS